MVSWSVEVEGTPLEAVSAVELTSGDEGKLGETKAVVGNTEANRQVESGDEATVYRNGAEEFTGRVTKAPTAGANQESIEYNIADNRISLRYIEVHRPFYEMDTGEIIRTSVQQEAQFQSPVRLHDGDDLSGWESETPQFELLQSSERRVHEYGSDIIFGGWPEGSNGEYTIRFNNVPNAAIPGDGQIVRLTTRMIVNNRGDQIECEVDLRDNAGNNYIWTPDLGQGGFQEHEFAAENAVPDAAIGDPADTDGTLEYRFKIHGNLAESCGVGIDHADVLPFSIKSRETDVDVSGVDTTGNVISRRFDENVMGMLKTVGEEDGYDSWMNSDKVLHYQPGGGRRAPLTISDSTPVTDYEFDRDYDRIVNKVTVQGNNDIQVTAADSASIEFYGISEREDQIVDREIQTAGEADRRATEFLEEKAWHDTAITFTIADIDFADVSVGELMTVQWSPEGVSSTYEVSEKSVDSDGYVTVSFTGYTGGSS